MVAGVIICFILGYLIIVFEHPLKLDKTLPALIMGALCWALISVGHLDVIDHHGHAVGHGGDDYGRRLRGLVLYHQQEEHS